MRLYFHLHLDRLMTDFSSVSLFLAAYQQFSGINAVLYYSTDILSQIMPQQAQSVALYVTGVNLVATFIPVFLIEVRLPSLLPCFLCHSSRSSFLPPFSTETCILTCDLVTTNSALGENHCCSLLFRRCRFAARCSDSVSTIPTLLFPPSALSPSLLLSLPEQELFPSF